MKIKPFSWFLNPLRDFSFRVITNKVMVFKSYLRVASGVFCMNVGFQFCTFKIVGGRVHSSMLFYKQPFSWFLNPSCDLPVEWLPPIITFWILCYGQHLWCKWWMYQKEVYFMCKNTYLNKSILCSMNLNPSRDFASRVTSHPLNFLNFVLWTVFVV